MCTEEILKKLKEDKKESVVLFGIEVREKKQTQLLSHFIG